MNVTIRLYMYTDVQSVKIINNLLSIIFTNLVWDGTSLHSLPQGSVGCQTRSRGLIPLAHRHLQHHAAVSAPQSLTWGSACHR